MTPILYNSTETTFTSNGLGRLSSATYCTVLEERNGQYELEMDYPVTGQHYDDIEIMRIIYAVPADGANGQPFEIYEISKPINGIVTIKARHISYRLNKVTVGAFTANTCAQAIAGLKTNSVNTNSFDFWTDKTVSANFKVEKPSQLRGLLGGQQGSILDVFGTGEYEFDKFTVKLYQHRGTDRGVTIAYGKNLTDINDENDAGSVYTGVLPFYYANDVLVVGSASYGDHRSDYPYDMLIPLDLTDRYDSPPTATTLTNAGASYISGSDGWQIKKNIKVSFVALQDTEEYKDFSALEHVSLCDTVTVTHPGLGISTSAKVVKTVYNVLLDRYDSIELGSMQTSLGQSITDEILTEVPTTSVMESAIANGTALMAGANGGCIKIKTDANGKPQEMLIMNTADESTATNIWRWNSAGIGYSSNGGTTYKQAWTIDGKFYTDWVTAGTINASLVNAGTLSSYDGKVQIVLGDSNTAGKLIIDSTNFDLDSSGNVTITGQINAQTGSIGGFTIDSDAIYTGTKGTGTTSGSITLGTYNFSREINGTTRSNLRLAIGSNFAVHRNGTLYASSATIAGTITAGSKTSLTSTDAGVYIGSTGVAVGRYKGAGSSYLTSLVIPADGSQTYDSSFPDSDGSVIIGKLYFRKYPPDTGYSSYGMYADSQGRIWTPGAISVNTLNLGANVATNYLGGTTVINTLGACWNDAQFDKDVNIDGDLTVRGSYPSDRNRKVDIKPLDTEDSREFIMGLNPVQFKWSNMDKNKHMDKQGIHHGMIAQEVDATNPKWAVVNKRTEFMGLEYTEMIADLIKVVQDQQKRIEALEAALEER